MEHFEKVKWMQLPREVLVGHGVLGEIGHVCRHLGLRGGAIVVTGALHTRKIAGERVVELLVDSGYEVQLAEVRAISPATIKRVEEIAKESEAGFVLGVGGGTIIDTAKIASFELGIPFISVPTIASHDGIASPRASIKGDDRSPVSRQAQAPLAVIADTQIISSAPFRFTAAGCGDIIANYTAVRDWRLAQRLQNAEFSTYAAALSEMTANMILENAAEIGKRGENATWTVVKALVSSGVAISIAGSSAPASGSEHKFSHALDMIADKPALHGEQCGVGTIMMSYLYGDDWQKIRDALKAIGAPTTAKELGIKDEYIIEALTTAHKINPERYTILGESGLTREAAVRLALATGVIE